MAERQVVLDTETTGLSSQDGHRIVEIGCVEIVNRRLSGRTLHFYVNPERDIDDGALQVHGLSRERLASEPLFVEIADAVLEFVAGAEVLIHNAPFDLGFLDAELSRLRRPSFALGCHAIVDTLALARELHPGRRNSLDALCERYGVSNAGRKLHGALLDAELLADVYLAMTRGQDSLAIPGTSESEAGATTLDEEPWPPDGLRVVRADPDELARHRALIESIGKGAVWA